MNAVTLLERPLPPTPGAGADKDVPAGPPHARSEALDAMLYAVRRMGLPVTDRQVAVLLDVAARHLKQPEPDEDFPHGTVRGYKRHRRRNESACAACREACRLVAAERRKREGRREPKPCGTEAAYHRHVRRFETPCEPCRLAHRDAGRERRRRAAAA
ncbi:hypothetical protein ABZ605_38105 [Streptomyces sp. NPDC012765]|uniref:hypothetical protein n=1 Tax=Streptomyces sp. NPDC012765 TaxID=3155249 RepID=UPI00340118B5